MSRRSVSSMMSQRTAEGNYAPNLVTRVAIPAQKRPRCTLSRRRRVPWTKRLTATPAIPSKSSSRSGSVTRTGGRARARARARTRVARSASCGRNRQRRNQGSHQQPERKPHTLFIRKSVTEWQVPGSTRLDLYLDHDRDDHGPATHLLVEEPAERVPDRVLEHLPFRIAAAGFVDGVEHLLAGRLQQGIGRLLAAVAAGDEVRPGNDLAGVLIHRDDHDEDAVLGQHSAVAQDDRPHIADPQTVDEDITGRDLVAEVGNAIAKL